MPIFGRELTEECKFGNNYFFNIHIDAELYREIIGIVVRVLYVLSLSELLEKICIFPDFRAIVIVFPVNLWIYNCNL